MFSKYEYIYAVYTEKSFTRAAKKLFISQPSLSAAVKNIENKVGAPLFERNGVHITPTEIGVEYIRTAEKIMRAEKDFENRIHDIYNLETGEITVGGTNYLCSYVLPKIINRFTNMYPKIKVTLMEANSGKLSEMMDNEEIDVIIDSYDETMDIYVGSQLLSERILLCVPSHWKINDKFSDRQIYPENIYNGDINIDDVPPVPINAFSNEPFIMLKKGNDMYDRATAMFGNWKITPNVIFNVDQLNISYSLVESGMGAGFITDTFFKFSEFGRNTVLYNIAQQHSSRILHIVYKKHRYLTSAMKKFITTAKEVVAETK
ncbi:MAG: LysR family transcriptional regulator [Clostridia bacterium]|nr:LysR family transcriptional regulator [Clostridia bacterium]